MIVWFFNVNLPYLSDSEYEIDQTSYAIGCSGATSRTLCTAPGRVRPYRRFNFSSPRWAGKRSVPLNPGNYPRYWPPVLCKWNPAIGRKNMVVNTLKISFCAGHSWREGARESSRERRGTGGNGGRMLWRKNAFLIREAEIKWRKMVLPFSSF